MPGRRYKAITVLQARILGQRETLGGVALAPSLGSPRIIRRDPLTAIRFRRGQWKGARDRNAKRWVIPRSRSRLPGFGRTSRRSNAGSRFAVRQSGSPAGPLATCIPGISRKTRENAGRQ